MAGKLALDTSAVLAFFDGHALASQAMDDAEAVCVPAIAIGELYFGVLKCRNPDQETAKIEALLTRCTVLPVDQATAQVYAQIIHQLETGGSRIPLNDIWIAALAMQHGCNLLARDAHFARIEGLEIIAL